MGRRVDVDEALAPVTVPGRVLNELCAHALETLPEECCGLIAGSAAERFGHVIRCRNDMTSLHHRDPDTYPRDGRRAFYMNEHDYLRAQERADAAGEQVTAVYHSHVGVGAYLSELDLEYAEHELFPFPRAAHIVLAVYERKVGSLGLFERDPGIGFVGRALVPA